MRTPSTPFIPTPWTRRSRKPGLEVIQDKIDFDVKRSGLWLPLPAALTTKPEVTIENYKGIEAVKKSAEVTDEDIDAEIKKVQERNSRMVTVEDPGGSER